LHKAILQKDQIFAAKASKKIENCNDKSQLLYSKHIPGHLAKMCSDKEGIKKIRCLNQNTAELILDIEFSKKKTQLCTS
jgi:hypothetical protein